MKYISDSYFYIAGSRERPGYITQFGHTYPSPSYCLIDRQLGRSLFDYIVSGKGYVELNGVRTVVEEGDLVYVRKGTILTYGADPDEPYEKLWIGADGPAIDSLCELYLGGRELVIKKNVDIEPINSLKTFFVAAGYDEKRVMQALLALIMTLSDLPKREDRRVDAVDLMAYIEDHITTNLSLDEMASCFHISKRHLIRIFKERYGDTPGVCHAKLRCASAARMLAESSRSIAEISTMLGYCDQSFFSSSFKKQLGCYPTAYRRQAREALDERSSD